MCQAGKGYSLWLCKSHEKEHPDATALRSYALPLPKNDRTRRSYAVPPARRSCRTLAGFALGLCARKLGEVLLALLGQADGTAQLGRQHSVLT